MFPQQVQLNEKNIEKLNALYRQSYAQIIGELEGATSFGVANRKIILSQIEKILIDLGGEVNGELKKEIAKYYEKGAGDAVLQLQKVSDDIPVVSGFNRIHQEAITALVDDAQQSFLEGLSGVNRTTQVIISQATRDTISQQMATGKLGGQALRTIKGTVIQTLREQGLTALKTRPWTNANGTTVQAKWTLDRYAEMLIRTKSVEARNRGLANRVAENGYDLVQVSSHGATDSCGDWEGKILSVSGETDGYPTVSEAEGDGLFHPNCRHAINVIIPELAKLTNAYVPDDETMSGEEFYGKYYVQG